MPSTMENNASKHIKITEEDENPPISNYRVSEGSLKILKSQGIETLFPIQSRCFDFVYDGLDLIGIPISPPLAFFSSDDEKFWDYCLINMRSPTPFRGLHPSPPFFLRTRFSSIFVLLLIHQDVLEPARERLCRFLSLSLRKCYQMDYEQTGHVVVALHCSSSPRLVSSLDRLRVFAISSARGWRAFVFTVVSPTKDKRMRWLEGLTSLLARQDE